MKAIGSGAFSAVVAGAYGQLDAEAVRVERHDLRLPKWDADGFRLAFITDVHVNDLSAVQRAQRAVRLALSEDPDVILFGGDFINFSQNQAMRNIENSFSELYETRCPCFAVLGNHDYWVNDPAKVISAVKERTAFTLLRNDVVEVEGVQITGIDDGIAGRHRPEIVASQSAKSVVVLFHEPDFVKEVPPGGSLQISGHSHGGQMCLPFGVPVHTPRGAKKYIAGFYPDAPTPLYVSRGVGTTGPTMRTFCPPEVSILTLRSA